MIRTIAASAALTVLLTACGGGGDEGVADEPTVAPTSEPAVEETEEAPSEGDTVLVQGFRFQPERLEVVAGSTVTWTNEDDIGHTATSGTPDAATGDFDVALDGKGASGMHTFEQPGTYAYFCEVHPSMRGEIVVT